jgi:hypothetical protein
VWLQLTHLQILGRTARGFYTHGIHMRCVALREFAKLHRNYATSQLDIGMNFFNSTSQARFCSL